MGSNSCVGVVTVTYNSASVLPGFLRSISAQVVSDFKLFVVDNASNDATLDVLGNCRDSRLQVIANRINLGVAEGNNQGIRAAREAGCDLVLLINNDTEFDNELLLKLSDALEVHAADMTCPKIAYFDEPQRIWAAGGALQSWLGYKARHFGDGEIDNGQHDSAREVDYVPTCCVLIRSEVFSRVGMMDCRYFVYVDDVDFMYRARKAGVRLMYVPDAKLLHKVGHLTGGDNSPFSIHYGTRNRLFFMIKHFGVLYSIPWLICCEILNIGKVLMRNRDLSWFRMKQSALRAAFQVARQPLSGDRDIPS